MNKYTAVDVSYIRPSRTIETILLENGNKRGIVYAYNEDGIYFHVFNFIVDVMNFFYNEAKPVISFETDEELNNYLANLELDTVYNASDVLI